MFQPFTITLLTRLRPRVAVGGDDAPLGRTGVLRIDTLLCTITSTTFCKHSNITWSRKIKAGWSGSSNFWNILGKKKRRVKTQQPHQAAAYFTNSSSTQKVIYITEDYPALLSNYCCLLYSYSYPSYHSLLTPKVYLSLILYPILLATKHFTISNTAFPA